MSPCGRRSRSTSSPTPSFVSCLFLCTHHNSPRSVSLFDLRSQRSRSIPTASAMMAALCFTPLSLLRRLFCCSLRPLVPYHALLLPPSFFSPLCVLCPSFGPSCFHIALPFSIGVGCRGLAPPFSRGKAAAPSPSLQACAQNMRRAPLQDLDLLCSSLGAGPPELFVFSSELSKLHFWVLSIISVRNCQMRASAQNGR
jgi:hypothetical protein